MAGATVTESPVCTPIGSMFSIEQTTTTLSLASRMSSSSNSFQPMMLCSSRTSWVGLASRPAPAMRRRSASSRAMPDPRPPRVKDGRIDHRIAEILRRLDALVQVTADLAARDLRAEAGDDLLEPLAVLAGPDGVDIGPDQLDVVLRQHALVVQGHRGVQRGLPAQGGQHRVGTLDRDDLLQRLDGDRLDVGGVGELGVGHDRGRVGVDQADPDALAAQDAARLGARVVELAALADDDRPRPDDQHGP